VQSLFYLLVIICIADTPLPPPPSHVPPIHKFLIWRIFENFLANNFGQRRKTNVLHKKLVNCPFTTWLLSNELKISQFLSKFAGWLVIWDFWSMHPFISEHVLPFIYMFMERLHFSSRIPPPPNKLKTQQKFFYSFSVEGCRSVPPSPSWNSMVQSFPFSSSPTYLTPATSMVGNEDNNIIASIHLWFIRPCA
jgi:hypothetical protein